MDGGDDFDLLYPFMYNRLPTPSFQSNAQNESLVPLNPSHLHRPNRFSIVDSSVLGQAQQSQSYEYSLENSFSRMNLSNSTNHHSYLEAAAMDGTSNFPSIPIDNHGLASRVINNNSNPWRINGIESDRHVVHPLQYHLINPSPLQNLKGRISSIAKDQGGSRFLQKKFDDKFLRREDIEMIYLELKDELHDLMVHQFGNLIILKLFESGDQIQRNQLLISLVSNTKKLLEVCTDMNGTRTVQKLMEIMERIAPREYTTFILSVLKPLVLRLTNDIYGHRIIQKCFEIYTNEETKFLVELIANHCVEIATDKSGCCIVQHTKAEVRDSARHRLLAKIISNATLLSQHPYGNYVVQYVIGLKNLEITSNLIQKLRGSFVSLSRNKYASNVVEKCLKEAAEYYSADIIVEAIVVEIMEDDDFLEVLQDPYGNYVVQSALKFSKGILHHNLNELIQNCYQHLQSHPYGKKVLARCKN